MSSRGSDRSSVSSDRSRERSTERSPKRSSGSKVTKKKLSRLREESAESDISEDDHREPVENLWGGGKWGTKAWQNFTFIKENVTAHGTVDRGKSEQGFDEGYDSDDVGGRCHCQPAQSGGPTCFDDSCVNYYSRTECPLGRCSTGCKNQRLQRKQRVKMEVFEAGGKGYGVKLLEEVAEGALLCEYVGEILGARQMAQRQQQASLTPGTRKLYMMQLASSRYLDARLKGGLARFLNHSCEPNCLLERWHAGGRVRCAVIAKRKMDVGTELTFDYAWVWVEGQPRTPCLCGAPTCRKYIEIGEAITDTSGGDGDADSKGIFREPTEAEASSGEGLIGQRVKIYWSGMGEYFAAEVVRYDPETKKHYVIYEGEEEEDGEGEDLCGKVDADQGWQIFEAREGAGIIRKKEKTANSLADLDEIPSSLLRFATRALRPIRRFSPKPIRLLTGNRSSPAPGAYGGGRNSPGQITSRYDITCDVVKTLLAGGVSSLAMVIEAATGCKVCVGSAIPQGGPSTSRVVSFIGSKEQINRGLSMLKDAGHDISGCATVTPSTLGTSTPMPQIPTLPPRPRERLCMGSDWFSFTEWDLEGKGSKPKGGIAQQRLKSSLQVAAEVAQACALPNEALIHACVILLRHEAAIACLSVEAAGMQRRLESNPILLAISGLLLSWKLLPIRSWSCTVPKCKALIEAAYRTQYPGRTLKAASKEDKLQWEQRLARCEQGMLMVLRYDLYLKDPMPIVERGGRYGSASPELIPEITQIIRDSAVQGLHLWLKQTPAAIVQACVLLASAGPKQADDLDACTATMLFMAGAKELEVWLKCAIELAEGLRGSTSVEYGRLVSSLNSIAGDIAASADADVTDSDLMLEEEAREFLPRSSSILKEPLPLTSDLQGVTAAVGSAGSGSSSGRKLLHLGIPEHVLESIGLNFLVEGLPKWAPPPVAKAEPTESGPSASFGLPTYTPSSSKWVPPVVAKPEPTESGPSASFGLPTYTPSSSMPPLPPSDSRTATPQAPLAVSSSTTVEQKCRTVVALRWGPRDKAGADGATEGSSASSSSSGIIGVHLGNLCELHMLQELHNAPTADKMGINSIAVPLVVIPSGSDSVVTAMSTEEDVASAGTFLIIEPVKYSLADVMKAARSGRSAGLLTQPLVRHLLKGVLEALVEIHAAGFGVRSLDPATIFITYDGTVKLSGLSSAQRLPPDVPQHQQSLIVARDTSGVSSSGTAISADGSGLTSETKTDSKHEKQKSGSSGLPAGVSAEEHAAAMKTLGKKANVLLAPELLLGSKKCSYASDAWAFGCLAAQMCLGKPMSSSRERRAQASFIFKTCGTPSKDNWPEGSKTPLFKELRPVDATGNPINCKPRLQKFMQTEAAAARARGRDVDELLCNLVISLLQLDPASRLSLKAALDGPYFNQPRPPSTAWGTEVIDDKDPAAMSSWETFKTLLDDARTSSHRATTEDTPPSRFTISSNIHTLMHIPIPLRAGESPPPLPPLPPSSPGGLPPVSSDAPYQVAKTSVWADEYSVIDDRLDTLDTEMEMEDATPPSPPHSVSTQSVTPAGKRLGWGCGIAEPPKPPTADIEPTQSPTPGPGSQYEQTQSSTPGPGSQDEGDAHSRQNHQDSNASLHNNTTDNNKINDKTNDNKTNDNKTNGDSHPVKAVNGSAGSDGRKRRRSSDDVAGAHVEDGSQKKRANGDASERPSSSRPDVKDTRGGERDLHANGNDRSDHRERDRDRYRDSYSGYRGLKGRSRSRSPRGRRSSPSPYRRDIGKSRKRSKERRSDDRHRDSRRDSRSGRDRDRSYDRDRRGGGSSRRRSYSPSPRARSPPRRSRYSRSRSR